MSILAGLLLCLQFSAADISANIDMPAETCDNIPIAMYHEVAEPEGPWKELYVEPDVFLEQMEWLQSEGFSTLSLKETAAHWRLHLSLPKKPVVLTFDDGYRSCYSFISPELAARDMTASFFIFPAKMDTANGLTGEMVAEMASDGMEIGAHSMTHINLVNLDEDAMDREIIRCRKEIENRTGIRPDFFCYPAGRYDDASLALTRTAGYLGAVTTAPGRADGSDFFLLRRIRINNSDGLSGFIRKIQG